MRGRPHLGEFKTIHLSLAADGYYNPASLNGRARNVQQRARDIPGEYERKARRLDLQYHSVPQEDPRGGPILAALRAWPAPIGLVFGAFGEASESVEELAQAITTKRAAAEWKAMGARTEAEAKAFIIAQLRRRWGCAAVQERARLLIARVWAASSAPEQCCWG